MGFLAQSMTAVILLAAVIEGFLFYTINRKCVAQQRTLHDIFVNMVKGLQNVPDRNSNQSFHDQFLSLLMFLERKVGSASKEAALIKRNIHLQLEKNNQSESFEIESLFNMCSAMVQIFPLLGILGTILALSQVTADSGTALKSSEVTAAFVMAIDTTLLGIFFSIVFTLLEARVLASVKRILDDTVKANQFIVSVLV